MDEHEVEAIDDDEITGTAVPATNGSPKSGSNAFTTLMSSKGKEAQKTSPKKKLNSTSNLFLGRDGLGAYTTDPGSFSSERVIYHTEKWVVIYDLYPKSALHLLLLPREKSRQLLHPFEAFEDPAFLSDVQTEVRKLRCMAAKELQRRYGKFSTQDEARQKAMTGGEDTTQLPRGRDWDKEIVSGIHAHPSMSHLHVHVLSVDRVSPCLRHRKHYNSFATPFLIDVGDFPLAKDDPRRHPGRQGYLDADLRCWRCGKNFRNRFTQLKQHLQEEFDVWKRE